MLGTGLVPGRSSGLNRCERNEVPDILPESCPKGHQSYSVEDRQTVVPSLSPEDNLQYGLLSWGSVPMMQVCVKTYILFLFISKWL